MKLILALMSLFVLSTAFADCVEDFRYLQNKHRVKLVKERTIELTSKRQMKFLIAPEQKVVSDYIKIMKFHFDGDNGLAVSTEQYRDRKTDIGIGYRISVTDGSEFSNVKYYLKVQEETREWTFPILFRVWEGRTRVSDFICE